MFGIWPRVVQNAHQYGLDGEVNRYRTWSETRTILENGGRIAMSLGSPLYPNGHLVMLAGFTSDGRVIVHDPAKSNGYQYIHDKTQLSQSWFNKGGVTYTFYPISSISSIDDNQVIKNVVDGFELYQNYPNPFNPTTTISWLSPVSGWQSLKIYDILGNEVAALVDEYKEAGKYEVVFDASSFSSGVYIYKIESAGSIKVKQMILLK